MASATPDLGALLKRATIDDHEAVLKACNVTLKQSKGDLNAQHAKVVALLKTDRFDDALRTLDAGGDGLHERTRYERAYALYKIGELEEAISLVQSIDEGRGMKHLEAQASYRLEDFAHAADLYRELSASQSAIDNEENDLRINAGATDAQLEWKRQGNLVEKKKPGREDLEAFETAYNAACGSIARGELGQSEFLLKRAKDLCNASDELSETEKIAETLPISVQQLYVLTRLGKQEEAERLASEINLEGISDMSTRQIGQNNQLSSTARLSNPFLSQRLFQDAPELPKTDQLFRSQNQQMKQNSLVLELAVGKTSSVAKSIQRKLSTDTSTALAYMSNLSVINAAAHAQSELGKLGLRKILPLLEKRPTDVGLAFTIVHLYILTSNHGSALTVLESLLNRMSSSQYPANADTRFAPGLVATVVSVYQHQNRRSQIKAEFAKAASYWRHKLKPPIALLQAAGLNLLESPKETHQEAARDIFSMLRDEDPTSRFATAGYVAAHAITSPERISKEAETLTPVTRLITGVDVSALESAGVPVPQSTEAQNLSRKRALEEKPKPAKKRVRKSRFPKDYDPNKEPDPERWLPLRDRSTYKPKGKKGRKKAEQLTQGGVSEKADGVKGGGEGIVQAKGGAGGGAKKGGKKKGKK